MNADMSGAPDIVVLKDTTHTARKRHPCGVCGGTIHSGDRYSAVAVVTDGDFEYFRMHISQQCHHGGCPVGGLWKEDQPR